MNITSSKVQNRNILVALAVGIAAMAGTSAHAADYAPFVQAEAIYTDNGYPKGILPGGYALGAGITTGVIFAQKHEFSISTSLTQWKGDQFIDTVTLSHPIESFELEQVPVLLNYRFHYSIGSTGRLNVFAGPSVGVIRQMMTWNVGYAGAVPPLAPNGSYRDSDWRLAYGGSVGASFEINRGWSIAATVRYLREEESSYSFINNATQVQLPHVDNWSYSLAVGYSW